MSPSAEPYITPEEYLARERHAQIKSEYLDGKIYAMAGASFPHTLLITNLIREISNQFKETDCDIVSNDLRVHIPKTGLYTYPDLVVFCAERLTLDGHGDTLLNPTILFEVLSPSTEKYDRGVKFKHYQTITSLREYVLVTQEQCLVEKFVRQPNDEWVYHACVDLDDRLVLSSVGVEVPLSEIYRRVQLPEVVTRETEQRG